jgi:hypothetical protein
MPIGAIFEPNACGHRPVQVCSKLRGKAPLAIHVLRTDGVRPLVEMDEIAFPDIDGADAEANLAGIESIKVDSALQGAFESIVEARSDLLLPCHRFEHITRELSTCAREIDLERQLAVSGGSMAKVASRRSSSRRTSGTSSLSWAWGKIPSKIKRLRREPNLPRRRCSGS